MNSKAQLSSVLEKLCRGIFELDIWSRQIREQQFKLPKNLGEPACALRECASKQSDPVTAKDVVDVGLGKTGVAECFTNLLQVCRRV